MHESCTVDGCETKKHSKSYCAMHSWRLKKHGTLHIKPRYNDLEDRLRHQIARPEVGCWEWDGSHTTAGYAVTRVHGVLLYVHRIMYEREHGALTLGLELDHLCRNRGCVKPAHLEEVTHAENMRRRSKSYLRERGFIS